MANNSRWNTLRAFDANRRIRRAKSPELRSTIRFESLEGRALLSVQPLGVYVATGVIPTAAATYSQWLANEGGNGHAYQIVSDLVHWPTAFAAAAQQPRPLGFSTGHLVTISSIEENSYLVSSNLAGVWIGFSDQETEGEWRWIDDTDGIWQDPDNFAEPVQTAFTNWEGDEPNDLLGEDYGILFLAGGWNDGQLSGGTGPYTVEFEPLPDLIRQAPIDESESLSFDVPQLVIAFSTDLDTAAGGFNPHSPTNPANWQLLRDGVEVNGSITGIDWLFNPDTNRHEVVLTLDAPLDAGSYILTARDAIHDLAGNALDGDNDGQPGGDFSRQFFIGSIPPEADAGGPYAITEGDGLQLDASGSFDVDAESSVYWTNVTEASLQSANDDGGGLAALVTDVAQPRGMAVDSVNQFAYWTEPGSLAIRRVSLDGSDVEETVAEVRNGAAGIAVDLTTGKVYWTDSDNSEINAAIRGGKIRRANLDGSQPEDVVATDLLHPGGIAVDSIENKVYWSDVEGHLDGSGRILRANLDGSNVETLLTGIDEATGLALDQRARTLYWAESATGRIQRANLDGSGLETILEVPATTVALNVETDTLYWTEGSGNVKRARLDGSDPFTIAAGVGEPWGIGVLPPLYFSWDLNSDGDFADAFGESPFLTWEQLAGFGIDDDGEYEIALRVEDGDGQTEEASATVLVANSVPSLVSITLSPDTICEGDGFTGAPAYNAFETVFPEAEGTFPFAIDNSGQIAGTVSIPNLHQGGFLRLIDGTLQPIEFPGRTYTQPLGMNNLSEIVGDTADESGHFKRGFIRRANGSFEEFDIPNVAGFQVNDINDLGQVVGVVSTLANTSQVFVREPQGQLKFFVIPAIGQHNAFGINNSGIVSGTDGYVSFLLNTADGSSTVFAYPGATQTQFSGINNRGQVAGMWFTEGAGVHGFILNPDGTYFGIDFPGARHTELRAVNDRGQVTGYYSPFQGSPRSGFIGTPDYDASKVVQLTGTVIDNGLNDTHELLVDWGDGNQSTAVVDPEARTFSGSHVYLDDDPSGTPSDQYMISVTVSDDDGGVASDSATVIVENDAPSGLVLDALTPIDLGDLATLNGAFTDPGVLDTHSILIDWGDGHTTTIQTQVGTRTFEATHPYLESNPGNEFTISVMVTDDDSGSVFASTTLVILDRPPAIEDLTISPAVADEGELVTVSGAIADPDLLDTHTVSVDWGDGSATVAVVDPQLRTFAATHAYLDDDPGGTSADQYPIAIRVTDDDGNFAETATSITVANVAPTLSIGDVPNKINVGVPFTVTAQATDPSPLDTFTFLWQVTRGGQSVAVAAGASFAFTPLDAGDYVFTLVGTDDDLGAAVTQLTLTVGPCLVPGDTNGDCAVGVVDLNNVRNHFGETGLGVVDLSFNAPSPGTLLDKDGVGVGFTHRLPGTGDGLSNTDANMDLEPGINGRLLLKSTNANANGGVNLEALEAPGVLQEGIGQDDFNLTATFLNVQLPNSGDHLTLYAGTAWNNTVRVGFHESNVYHIAINRGFGDEILYSTAVNAFAPGDDVTLTLSRRMGNWSVSWQNHTNPAASGESTAFELAFLNVEFDLYLGVQHTSPTTTVQQTATIDSFTLDILRPIPGDSNGDFIVNLIDLNAVRNNFGTSFPAPQASRSADDVTVGKPKSLARPGASNLVDAVFAQFASNGALNDLASAWPALKRRRA